MVLRTTHLGAALFSLLLLGSCAPTLEGLLEQRAYSEALCAAAYHSDSPQTDRATVVSAIETTAELGLHLRAVTSADLAQLAGETHSRTMLSRRFLVRVVVAKHQLSLRDLRVTVALGGEDGIVDGVLADRRSVAAWTGEPAPPSRTEVLDRGGRRLVRRLDLGALLAAIGEGLTLTLIPVMDLAGYTKRFPRRTRRIEPTPMEYRAKAPVAAAILDGLIQPPSGGGASAIDYQLYDTQMVRNSSHVVVTIEGGAWCREDGVVTFQRCLRLALPEGDTLSGRINALFESGERRITPGAPGVVSCPPQEPTPHP